MLGLHCHCYPAWVYRIANCFGNLLSQSLLDLQPASKNVHNARNLAKANDMASGKISNVATSNERKQMMLTKTVYFYVPDDHHFVIIYLEQRVVQYLANALTIPAS